MFFLSFSHYSFGYRQKHLSWRRKFKIPLCGPDMLKIVDFHEMKQKHSFSQSFVHLQFFWVTTDHIKGTITFAKHTLEHDFLLLPRILLHYLFWCPMWVVLFYKKMERRTRKGRNWCSNFSEILRKKFVCPLLRCAYMSNMWCGALCETKMISDFEWLSDSTKVEKL